jgi:threonine/homoserine/homoserine lactone efflux protein
MRKTWRRLAPGSTACALVGRGLLVNLTNPKSILFFASVFAALLPSADPFAARFG